MGFSVRVWATPSLNLIQLFFKTVLFLSKTKWDCSQTTILPFKLTCKRFPKNIAKCYEKHQAARQGFNISELTISEHRWLRLASALRYSQLIAILSLHSLLVSEIMNVKIING